MNDKYLTWLPDEKATVQVENRIGPVHPAAPDTFYDDVIQAMDGGEELSGMTSARQELRKQIRSGEAYVWRGMIAFCLLEDLRFRTDTAGHAGSGNADYSGQKHGPAERKPESRAAGFLV